MPQIIVTILFWVLFCISCLVLFAAVFVVLGMRDARRNRLIQQRRPIDDRIAEIKNGAAQMSSQLQKLLDQSDHYKDQAAEWVRAVIAYYRRLEAIASDPASSSEAARSLAEEASKYVREHRLKGIFVAESSRKLAQLIEEKRAA